MGGVPHIWEAAASQVLVNLGSLSDDAVSAGAVGPGLVQERTT
jgi:hypothetical protein